MNNCAYTPEFSGHERNNRRHAIVLNCQSILCLFFICARLELFCDFLQFDLLHERAAFYDILAHRPNELFYENKSRSEAEFQT